jgi:nucleotide-binding universal stress UspA family protein
MPRITHILCPVDLSDCSRAAISRAVELRKATGARLTLLSVLPPPPEFLAPYCGASADAESEPTGGPMSGSAAGSQPGVVVLTSEAPNAAPEIAAQADHLAADLIVMGRNGRPALERLFLGSVAKEVIRRARIPVLVVPSKPASVSAGDEHEILCAVDFTECSRAALVQAVDLASALGHRLSVLHVVPPVVVADTDMALPADALRVHAAAEREAAHELTSLVTPHKSAGPRIVELVRTGAAPAEIVAAAVERHAWLIVLGTHGRTAVQRLLFGSTTNRVVHEARCAVMTVPGAARAMAAA